MSYAEFVHHIAYYQMAPWGDDWNQAQAVAAAAIAASPKFKRLDLSKFFPKPKRVKSQEQSPDVIFGFFKQAALAAEAQRKAQGGG
jgi:hypothetical protein